MRPSHILWDFNGTILDDVMPCIKSINELLIKYGKKPLSGVAEYQKVFGFPIKDYYARIGFDFNEVSFEVLAIEWVELYNKYNDPIKACPHAEEALKYVKSAGIPQLILTASKTEMVYEQLDMMGLRSYFDGVIGLDNIHAAGKTDIALEWAKRANPARPVLIGDTEHDAQTADAIGAECLLVSCGHMPAEKLLPLKPVFDDPLAAVRSLFTPEGQFTP